MYVITREKKGEGRETREKEKGETQTAAHISSFSLKEKILITPLPFNIRTRRKQYQGRNLF